MIPTSNTAAAQRALYFLPALLWALLIYSLSTADPAQLPKIQFFSADKIGHLLFYAVLSAWLFWAMERAAWQSATALPKAALLLGATIAAAYGATLEWVQAFLPHRSFDYADMLANCVGAALAIAGYWFFRAKAPRKKI